MAGGCGCCRTRRSTTFRKCSIADMSGEHAGQDNMLTFLAPRMFRTVLAACGMALSVINDTT